LRLHCRRRWQNDFPVTRRSEFDRAHLTALAQGSEGFTVEQDIHAAGISHSNARFIVAV
jgi:hypothetical protein